MKLNISFETIRLSDDRGEVCGSVWVELWWGLRWGYGCIWGGLWRGLRWGYGGVWGGVFDGVMVVLGVRYGGVYGGVRGRFYNGVGEMSGVFVWCK